MPPSSVVTGQLHPSHSSHQSLLKATWNKNEIEPTDELRWTQVRRSTEGPRPHPGVERLLQETSTFIRALLWFPFSRSDSPMNKLPPLTKVRDLGGAGL